MNANHVVPFIRSVRNVCSTMAATTVNVGKPIAIAPQHESGADVSAVIGLSGDIVGCVVLGFPMATATGIASRFAGTEIGESHPDLSDALGELANMVAGQAKAELDGLEVSISLPNVVLGKAHVVSQSKHSPRLGLPCESDVGAFRVEVAIEPAVGRETCSVMSA